MNAFDNTDGKNVIVLIIYGATDVCMLVGFISVFFSYIMKRKMPRIWFVLLLTSIALVVMVCFVYGVVAIAYPLFLTLSFFGGYLIMAVRAWRQADLNPGLEKLRPRFWSDIYDVWLFVTDREKWRSYASSFACIFGALLGSVFGLALQVYGEMSFSIAVASWISGIYLMLSIAIFMAKR